MVHWLFFRKMIPGFKNICLCAVQSPLFNPHSTICNQDVYIYISSWLDSVCSNDTGIFTSVSTFGDHCATWYTYIFDSGWIFRNWVLWIFKITHSSSEDHYPCFFFIIIIIVHFFVFLFSPFVGFWFHCFIEFGLDHRFTLLVSCRCGQSVGCFGTGWRRRVL